MASIKFKSSADKFFFSLLNFKEFLLIDAVLYKSFCAPGISDTKIYV